MINVCVVNPNFYRSSGVTVLIRRLFENLPKDRVRQYCVDCQYGSEPSDTSWLPADQLASFDLMASNPVTLLKACLSFSRWLEKHDIRVVHVHHRRLAAILQWLSCIRSFEVIYTGNLTYPYQFWFWASSPKIAVGITQSVIDNLKETTRAKQLEFISNPTNFPRACPQIDLARAGSAAICIARFDPVKNHAQLIEAWKIMFDRGHRHRLVLIGEGVLREALELQATALGLAELIEFRGFQSDVVPHIEDALFAVLTSRLEGQGIVTIEAAAQGRASLVTNVDGSRDMVPSRHGLPNLVALDDVPALAAALEAWFADPEATVAEGRLFFDSLRTASSSAVVAERYTALYEQAAAAGRGR